MGYRLLYGPIKRRKANTQNRFALLGFTLGFFALFWVLAWQTVPEEMTVLCNHLLPQAQIKHLVEDLKNGENILDAITVFCEDVLHDR